MTNIQIDNVFQRDDRRDQFYEPKIGRGYDTLDTPQDLGFNQNPVKKRQNNRRNMDPNFQENYGKLMGGHSAPT